MRQHLVSLLRPVALLCLAALPGGAFALEPMPTAADSGVVTKQITVTAGADAVRAQLCHASDAVTLSSEVISVKATPSGNCERVKVQVKGLLSPMEYDSIRCPTATGWSERLISSDDFEKNSVDWEVQPVEGGTRITLRILAIPKIPVPKAMVVSRVKAAAVTTLDELKHRLGVGK